MSKGAFHRIAGFVELELEDDGIRCFNVQPGLIATERIGQDMGEVRDRERRRTGRGDRGGVAWLCTAPEAQQERGLDRRPGTDPAELGLLPGWDAPSPVSVPAGDGAD